MAASLAVAFGSIAGFGVAVPSSEPRSATFTAAMWTIRSPNVCCASVGRKAYVSAGISAAILCIVFFSPDQSFSNSACSDRHRPRGGGWAEHPHPKQILSNTGSEHRISVGSPTRAVGGRDGGWTSQRHARVHAGGCRHKLSRRSIASWSQLGRWSAQSKRCADNQDPLPHHFAFTAGFDAARTIGKGTALVGNFRYSILPRHLFETQVGVGGHVVRAGYWYSSRSWELRRPALRLPVNWGPS